VTPSTPLSETPTASPSVVATPIVTPVAETPTVTFTTAPMATGGGGCAIDRSGANRLALMWSVSPVVLLWYRRRRPSGCADGSRHELRLQGESLHPDQNSRQRPPKRAAVLQTNLQLRTLEEGDGRAGDLGVDVLIGICCAASRE
jgi:hypothetical protein